MDLSTLDPEVLEFIAAIVASIVALFSACAWPLALLLLAIVLRKPILNVLPYLTRFKAGSFEFEFGRRILELERKADNADIPGIEQALPDEVDPEISSLYRLAEVNGRAAILESWLLVESAISEAAVRLGVRVPGVPSRPLYGFLKNLTKRVEFSMELFSIISELRHLRNKAVHEVEFEIGLSETIDYIDLSIRVANVLSGQPE